MKKLFFIALTATLALTTACNKINDLLTFDLSYASNVTIGANSAINLPFDVFTPDITTNAESEFASRSTVKDKIDKITLKAMSLQVTSPADQSLDFLKSIEIYIKADGLGELKIAEKTAIPDSGAKDLTLTVAENDIAAYVKKDKFSLRVKVTTDKTITKQVDLKVNSTYEVKAKLL